MENKFKSLDSALAIGFFTALSYAVGYNEQLNDARRFHVPHDLLPNASFNETILSGFLLIFIISLLLAFACAVLVLISKLIPVKLLEKTKQDFIRRYHRHKSSYTVLFILTVGTLLWHFSANPFFTSSKYLDINLPKVSELEFTDSTNKLHENLEYFSRTDGWVVLKRPGKAEFILLKEDKISRLTLSVAK